MTTQYLGQIEAFAFGYAPNGWNVCAGQLLPIAQNQALFSLLGTTYGGNGIQTFALPDLRSRVAGGFGAATTTPVNYVLGEVAGQENYTLLPSDVPAHTHALNAVNNGTIPGTQIPDNTVYPSAVIHSNAAINAFDSAAPTVALAPVTPSGSSTPHTNIQPYNTLNYCIAINGIFPSRN